MSKELDRSPICQDLNLEKAEHHDAQRSVWRSICIIVTCTAAMVVNVCPHRNHIMRYFYDSLPFVINHRPLAQVLLLSRFQLSKET
jgi:hypothetical protein